MEFPGFDLQRIARALARLESVGRDHADGFFERSEEVELRVEDGPRALRVRREDGFALRLSRPGKSWIASRDGLSAPAFASAFRQVARSLPEAAALPRVLAFPPWPEIESEELLEFPSRLELELRQRRVGFPLRLRLRRHRRWLQVVGTQFAPPPEHERFYSLLAELPGGRYGVLLVSLADLAPLADSLVELFRSRNAEPPPERDRATVILGPSAAAVFLHEAVAHSLEADVLALSGDPAAAIGLELGPTDLHLLDDPAAAPLGVARTTDDEGTPVVRRWLLRGGRVEQLIADRRWAERLEGAVPGAGRCADRHALPVPRSAHLELVAGSCDLGELIQQADGGLYLEEASRGLLDPLSGRFWIEAPWTRVIAGGELGERRGKCRVHGTVGGLVGAVTAIGKDARVGGAGWCAKAEQKVAVWATAPALRLEGVAVALAGPGAPA